MPRIHSITKKCSQCPNTYEVITSKRTVCYDCKPKQPPRKFPAYTAEQCREIAKECVGWQDLINRDKTAYYRIQTLGLYSEIGLYYKNLKKASWPSHIEKKLAERVALASKYSSFQDFVNNEPSMYRWFRWHSFDICTALNWTKKLNKMDSARLSKALEGSQTKYELQKNFNSEYNYMRKQGLWNLYSEKFPEYANYGFLKSSFETFEYLTLYIIQIYDEYELFYKFGITSKTVEARYLTCLPYEYTTLAEFTAKSSFVIDVERYLKKITAKARYRPFYKFGGSFFECFIETDTIKVDSILREILV